MIIRPQLKKFVDEEILQKSILQSSHDTMKQWKHSHFGNHLRHIITKAGDASNVREAAQILASSFNDISWLYDLISKLCELQHISYFSNIELRSAKNHMSENLMLHQDQKISLYIAAIKKQKVTPKPISHCFGPDMVVNIFVKTNGAIIQSVALDEQNIVHSDITTTKAYDGYCHIYDNRKESVNIISQDADTVILRAVVKRQGFNATDSDDPKHHHNQEFESNNDKSHVTIADETTSRAQLMFSILRASAYKNSIPIFQQWLTQNISYDMRWYVMREFLALDLENALPLLQKMADNDPHPQIRQTASDTLKYIYNQYPQLSNNRISHAIAN